MATLTHSYLLFILPLVWHTKEANAVCDDRTGCNGSWDYIRFPFWLSEANQSSSHRAYPGFELTCNKNNESLLTLPESGDFAVDFILYELQKVWVKEPDNCLPRRIIMLNHGFSLAGSPFQLSYGYTLANYSFYNCPLDVISSYATVLREISCLRSTINKVNYSVVGLLSNSLYNPPPPPWNSSCHMILSALVPVQPPAGIYWIHPEFIELKWENPGYCGDYCELNGGCCGLTDDSSLQVACNIPHHRKGKSGLNIGLVIAGVLCIIGLVFFFLGKTRMPDQPPQARIELPTLSIPHQPPVIVTGLDGASIEKYPKTQLGESGRLPNPNDNICSICLCEYLPKETLWTIPECNHYFHANCIDKWLKINDTCPVCRS